MDYTTSTPAPDFQTHYEIAGSFTIVCDNMLEWIKNEGLCKEQILSITTHETEIENGDALLVILYRTKQDESMTKIDATLKYHLIKNIAEWDKHIKEISSVGSKHADVIAFTNTPRNIGSLNISILWYIENPSTSNYLYVKHFKK